MRKEKQFLLTSLPSSNFFLTLPVGRTCQGINSKEGLWFAQHQKAMLKSRFGVSDKTLIKNICIHNKGKKQQQWMHQHVNSGYYWMLWEDDEWFNSIETFLHFLILLQKKSHTSFVTLYKKVDFWLKRC